jgi:ABC-2 type transport system permease protein
VVEAFSIYRRLVGARIRSDLQYRTSFVLFTISQFVVTFLDFLAIALIFENIPSLAGWSLAEVAFLYGTSGVAFGLGDAFISQVEDISFRIKMGTFDQVLIRPVGTLLQVVADGFALRRFGKVAQAAVVLAVALGRVDVDWTAGRAAMVVVMIAAGAVIFSAVWVTASTILFWTVEGNQLMNSFTYGANFLSQYPLQVYAGWLRRLLAFFTGVAFVNFFPALYVLDKPDPFGLPGFVRFLSPLVAAAAALVASFAWRFAVRHYRSTGS